MEPADAKLRIAIFTDSFLPMISGVVTATINLAKALADRGHFVLIVNPGSKKESFTYPNIRVESVASIRAHFYENFKWSAPFSPRIREIVKNEQIEVIHFMTPFTVSFVGINIARALGLPVVGTFHTFISDPSNYRHFVRGRIFDVKEESVWHYSNLYYNAADINTAPAESTRREMMANGSRVAIHVISNGIDPGIFDNREVAAFRKRYNLGDTVLLYFGRISQDKNMTTLLNVFFKVAETVADAQLLIIGEGPQRKKLQQMAAEHPAGKRVIFTGGIPHDALIRSGVFAACRLFVTASETENQPMTILEAQVNGIPCVGFNVRGIPDLVKDGVNGRVLPKGDSNAMACAVSEILKDTTLHKTLAENTRKMVQEHFMSHVATRWEELYRSLRYDYQKGVYPQKERLHLTQILGMLKEIQITLR